MDFNYSFTPSGRVRINGNLVTKFELGTFIHSKSIELGFGYSYYLHCSIYADSYSYSDLVYFFKDFVKNIKNRNK